MAGGWRLWNQAYFVGCLLSGVFTPVSLDRKGLRRFIQDRLLRLGVPLLVFTFVFSPTLALGLTTP
jgi:glucans biosynthesis protein C